MSTSLFYRPRMSTHSESSLATFLSIISNFSIHQETSIAHNKVIPVEITASKKFFSSEIGNGIADFMTLRIFVKIVLEVVSRRVDGLNLAIKSGQFCRTRTPTQRHVLEIALPICRFIDFKSPDQLIMITKEYPDQFKWLRRQNHIPHNDSRVFYDVVNNSGVVVSFMDGEAHLEIGVCPNAKLVHK